MKTIRVLIPTYNEQENIEELVKLIKKHFEVELPQYAFIIQFIDNKSTDNTRALIRKMATEDKRIQAIFNARNFGQFNSQFHGLVTDNDSDCTIIFAADFQDPVELIKQFVNKWEEGFQVVAGIKSKSKENKIMRFFRTRYYKFVKRMSAVKQFEHFTGFALYDKSFIETLRRINDPAPFLRGLVAELCGNLTTIEYVQERRKGGKTSYNFARLYDVAMLSITTYTKRLPRLATVWGAVLSGLSFAGTIALGVASVLIPGLSWSYMLYSGLALIGFLNMFFIGILGEYILTANTRLLNRPLVIEQERINFDK